MKPLKWIKSNGGPLVLNSSTDIKNWSGIYNRELFLNNQIEEVVEDFLNSDETDYGLACLVENYLGIINKENIYALVLGDEPLPTTIFVTNNSNIIVARISYIEDIDKPEIYLSEIELNKIKNWEYALDFSIEENQQILFDSAYTFKNLIEDNIETMNVAIIQGNYKIWTALYNPNSKTSFIVHKFVKTNK